MNCLNSEAWPCPACWTLKLSKSRTVRGNPAYFVNLGLFKTIHSNKILNARAVSEFENLEVAFTGFHNQVDQDSLQWS